MRRISQNAKCRYCGHSRGLHFPLHCMNKMQCLGDVDGKKCDCAEFEIQIEDRTYAAARELQEALGEL